MRTKQVNPGKLANEVQRDLARIQRSWEEYKKAVPRADLFSFLARIAATGRIPTVLQRQEVA